MFYLRKIKTLHCLRFVLSISRIVLGGGLSIRFIGMSIIFLFILFLLEYWSGISSSYVFNEYLSFNTKGLDEVHAFDCLTRRNAFFHSSLVNETNKNKITGSDLICRTNNWRTSTELPVSTTTIVSNLIVCGFQLFDFAQIIIY